MPPARVVAEHLASALRNQSRETIMFDAYVIEIGKAAAGIIVKDGNRFMFCASDSQFNALDGQLFCNARDAEAAALRHLAASDRHTRHAPGARLRGAS
jgi:hypothetical protein